MGQPGAGTGRQGNIKITSMQPEDQAARSRIRQSRQIVELDRIARLSIS